MSVTIEILQRYQTIFETSFQLLRSSGNRDNLVIQSENTLTELITMIKNYFSGAIRDFPTERTFHCSILLNGLIDLLKIRFGWEIFQKSTKCDH